MQRWDDGRDPDARRREEFNKSAAGHGMTLMNSLNIECRGSTSASTVCRNLSCRGGGFRFDSGDSQSIPLTSKFIIDLCAPNHTLQGNISFM